MASVSSSRELSVQYACQHHHNCISLGRGGEERHSLIFCQLEVLPPSQTHSTVLHTPFQTDWPELLRHHLSLRKHFYHPWISRSGIIIVHAVSWFAALTLAFIPFQKIPHFRFKNRTRITWLPTDPFNNDLLIIREKAMRCPTSLSSFFFSVKIPVVELMLRISLPDWSKENVIGSPSPSSAVILPTWEPEKEKDR